MTDNDPQVRDGPQRWSLGNVVVTIVWLTISLAVSFFLFVYAWFLESEIAYGIGEHSSLSLPLLVIGTSFALAAGPLGVWLVRRTKPWLIAAAILAVLGLASALPKSPAERVQDEIRAIPVPASWGLEFEKNEGYGAPLFGERDSATHIFSSSQDVEQTCIEARAALARWAMGATVEDRQEPPQAWTPPCDLYVARDGTFAALVVYDRAGWDRHEKVMDYDFVPSADAQSFVRLSTTDTGS